MPSAILASIGCRFAVADGIADSRVDGTRPIAKIWVNGLDASCDTTRALVQCLLILFNNMRLLRMLQGWQADRKQI